MSASAAADPWRLWLAGWVLLTMVLAASAASVVLGALESSSGDAVTFKIEKFSPGDVTLRRHDDGTFSYEITTERGTTRFTPEAFTALLHEAQSDLPWWKQLLNTSSAAGVAWVLLGLLGQMLFSGRMVLQWVVTERQRRSVVPVGFWWLSLAGASMLLVYFVWRKDIVGVIGQCTGWLIYSRNLYFIYSHTESPHAG